MNEYLILFIWCVCILILYKLFVDFKSVISQYEQEVKNID